MVMRVILYCYLLLFVESFKPRECLTGYMTDLQGWVDENGELTDKIDQLSAVDLSAIVNPVPLLQQRMSISRAGSKACVKYLSLARCRLNRVPTVFQLRDWHGRDLAETVEYMTFFGNSFQDISSPGEQYEVSLNATQARERIVGFGYQMHPNAVWSTGFKETSFPRLKELDLRSCSIQVLSGYIFEGMYTLEALYLGENEIVYIDANAFIGLKNLNHLDFSRNEAYDEIGHFKTLTMETFDVFEPLEKLTSLDFSFTKMSHRHNSMFKGLGPNLTRMSLCNTGLSALDDNFFNRTSLKILDLSGNNGILTRPNVLRGLEDKLQVLYAQDIGLRTTSIFSNLRQLEILGLSQNEITSFSIEVAKSLRSLRILDLDKNRIGSWWVDTFKYMTNLQLLSLKDNNINLISEEMIDDIANVNYIALSGNFIVCNCHTRDFFDLALRNEQIYKNVPIRINTTEPLHLSYHRGYIDYSKLIKYRNRVFINDSDEEAWPDDLQEDAEGNFLLLDFNPASYTCLQVSESRSVEFSDVTGCNRAMKNIDYDQMISEGINKLYILLTIPSLLVLMAFGFWFRRNFRYCFITMRNSALLSVINQNEVLDEGAIFHYDVFVSYCNEDRNWVLNHLLPTLENDCSISACLHERDFQVGYSILENIVSCMDRSRSIMLIISQRFLLSQWCQFEMHLAQHRLLETRREDLTLVLLEEIPRRLRPNTLHYLMMTKTYIVWPKDENERSLFWKRLNKTLVTIKQKQGSTESVSLA